FQCLLAPLRLALSRDGKRLAAGNIFSKVEVWDLAGKAPRLAAQLAGLGRFHGGLAFAPDGRMLAAASAGGAALQLWDLTASPPVERTVAQGPLGALHAVAWSQDGRRIIATGEDERAWVW